MAAYTNHIGRSARDRGKDTTIRTASNLADAERHNNHDYTQADVDRMESDINLSLRYLNHHYVLDERGDLVELKGKLDLYDRVKSIYEREFTQSVNEYNQRQRAAGHSERQIKDYFEEISGNKKQEIAVEGLIQIGSYDEEWSKLGWKEKLRMVPILVKMLEETLKELNKGNNRFVLAGASLHLNEGSPHIHYVGVPIHESPTVKKGLNKRVKKSAVFTAETLGEGLQDRVRAKIEPLVEAEFGWKFDEKKTGRNEDLSRNTIANEKLKEQIRRNEEELKRQEALKRAQKDELSVLEAKTTQARLEASEASQRALEASQQAWATEMALADLQMQQAELEENVEILQTYEEYLHKVDEVDSLLDRLERFLDGVVGRAKELFWDKDEGIAFVEHCRDLATDIYNRICAVFGLVKDFEKNVSPPLEQPESPRLQDRIAAAAARVRPGASKDDRDLEF